MITLRDLSRNDRAIGSITGDELRLIARILEAVGRSWFLRLLLPRETRKPLDCRMLAATLNRTPAERLPSLNEQIRLAMLKGREETAKA